MNGHLQDFAGDVADGVPHGEPADCDDGEEHDEDVAVVDADGVGVDDEHAALCAHADESKRLLQPAEQQSQGDACDGTEGGYHTAFEEEYLSDLSVVGAKVAQGGDVVLLVDNEHGQRADDVEAGHDEDEGQEDVGEELFNLHDAERVGLLLVAVEHAEAVASDASHLPLHAGEVGAVLQAQFERREHALLVEDAAREADGSHDVVTVVLALSRCEDHAWHDERVDLEALLRVGEVELTVASGCIDVDVLSEAHARAQLLCQADAHGAVLEVGGMQLELAVAIDNFVDMGEG